jgi:hypothetical protein
VELKIFLNNRFKIVWKEIIMTLGKTESWKWSGRTEENTDYP